MGANAAKPAASAAARAPAMAPVRTADAAATTSITIKPAQLQSPMYAWCNTITLAIPQIKLKPCMDAQLDYAPVKSVQGRHIMWREFKPADIPAARVLVVGGIHGDELTSVSIVFRWFERLSQPNADAAH